MTRDEAIKWLQGIEERYFHGGDEDFDKRRREAVRMAIEALSIEVVRCKDCKFWQTDWLTSHDGYHYCAMVDIIIDGDFYCKDGERKILPKD